MSVVEATPQPNFEYLEQESFVIHPAPLVVHVEMTALHYLSVTNVNGSKSQFKGIQD